MSESPVERRGGAGIVLVKDHDDPLNVARFTPVVMISPFIPPEYVPVIRPLLDGLLGMVPTWCQQIEVTYSANPGDGVSACVTAKVHYRKAVIEIGPSFMTQTAGARLDTLAHEMAHLLTAPMLKFGDMIIDATEYRADSPEQKFLAESWRIALEATTQDITRAFLLALETKREVSHGTT